jgi:hypothetical protein
MESGHGMLDHPGSPLSFPTKEPMPVPALEPYLIEPIWQQFSALIPERQTTHPLGCHRPRIPDHVVFEKLVQVLVFGCAYERSLTVPARPPRLGTDEMSGSSWG